MKWYNDVFAEFKTRRITYLTTWSTVFKMFFSQFVVKVIQYYFSKNLKTGNPSTKKNRAWIIFQSNKGATKGRNECNDLMQNFYFR